MNDAMMRRMHLVGMVNPPTSQYAENWRNPLGRADWLRASFYTDLGRTLERGLFDMIFFADALAVPEAADGSYDTTLLTGGKEASTWIPSRPSRSSPAPPAASGSARPCRRASCRHTRSRGSC